MMQTFHGAKLSRKELATQSFIIFCIQQKDYGRNIQIVVQQKYTANQESSTFGLTFDGKQ